MNGGLIENSQLKHKLQGIKIINYRAAELLRQSNGNSKSSPHPPLTRQQLSDEIIDPQLSMLANRAPCFLCMQFSLTD